MYFSWQNIMLNLFKKFPAILIALLLFTSISFSEIEVKISVNKNEFLEAEPIICALSFVNNSDAVDSISFDELDFFHIKIQINENKELIYIGSSGDYIGSIRYIKLGPFSQRIEKFNLLRYYIDKIVTLSINSAPGYLSAGSYSMKYNFKSKLTSNECSFVVNQPSGSDAIEFQKLMQAYRIIDGRPETIDSSYVKKDLYYDIAKNYPESAYWEEAVFRYNSITDFLSLSYADTNVNMEFIKRYPNSYFAKVVILNLWKSIFLYEGGETAVESNMKYVIENFENSIISEIAKEQQSKKDYQK